MIEPGFKLGCFWSWCPCPSHSLLPDAYKPKPMRHNKCHAHKQSATSPSHVYTYLYTQVCAWPWTPFSCSAMVLGYLGPSWGPSSEWKNVKVTPAQGQGDTCLYHFWAPRTDFVTMGPSLSQPFVESRGYAHSLNFLCLYLPNLAWWPCISDKYWLLIVINKILHHFIQ